MLTSPADSGVNPEIITGLRYTEPDVVERLPWGKESMFAHLHTNRSSSSVSTKPPVQPPLREQLRAELASATRNSTENSVYCIIYSAFLHRVRALLLIDEIDEDVSLIDLGIDSLVASEIGSWARKELGVRIPNSVIFGGASVRDIAGVAVRGLDQTWILEKNEAVGGK